MRRWILAMGGALLMTAPIRRDEEVYFFFSPENPSPGAARVVVEYGGRRVRPCLLVEDFRTPPGPTFLETVEILASPIAVYDPEAILLAKRLGIRRVPAVVVVREGKAHVYSGEDLQEIPPCSK